MCNRLRHITGTNMSLYRGFISYYALIAAQIITFSYVQLHYGVHWVIASSLTSLVTTPIELIHAYAVCTVDHKAMLKHYTVKGKAPPDVFSGVVPYKIREIC